MSGLSLPVNRPTGRALLVAAPGSRAKALSTLRDLGFGVTESDDPYAAMTELCRRPLVYRAIILSLASLYREELSIVAAVKARFPHVEVWLAQTDGRQAALAEGMRLGADGLLAEDGLHRVAHPAKGGPAANTTAAAMWTDPPGPAAGETDAAGASALKPHDAARQHVTFPEPIEPILTADELRALLHERAPVAPDAE